MDATTGEVIAVQPANARIMQPSTSKAIGTSSLGRLRAGLTAWVRDARGVCCVEERATARVLLGITQLPVGRLQILQDPLQAPAGSQTLGIDLQRPLDVLQPLPWAGDRGQDQPRVLQLRRELGGSLGKLAGKPAVALAERLAGLLYGDLGLLQRCLHGVTVGTGVGSTFSLFMKHRMPLTTPSAT